MPGTVSALWRHPIKGHGREEVSSVDLGVGRTMPGDRVWAVTHEASKTNGGEWARCANFSRGSKTPALQGIRTKTDDDGTLRLTHPNLPDIAIDPATDSAAFVAWVTPLMDSDRAQSTALVPSGPNGMTDSPFPSISLINMASHRVFEQTAGRPLNPLRWRGNVLMDGLAPWKEFEWVGKEITLGHATLLVKERIVRCNATRANPDTGQIDFDTLALLSERWDHQEFGVYGEVIEGGLVETGSTVALA